MLFTAEIAKYLSQLWEQIYSMQNCLFQCILGKNMLSLLSTCHIFATGTYPAGGGIVQTSQLCSGNGWKLPHGSLGCQIQLQRQFQVLRHIQLESLCSPSSTHKIFLPSVIPLSITCRQDETFPSSSP